MTVHLTYDLYLQKRPNLRVNQHVKYLDQKSFSSKVFVRTQTRPIALTGPLEWLINNLGEFFWREEWWKANWLDDKVSNGDKQHQYDEAGQQETAHHQRVFRDTRRVHACTQYNTSQCTVSPITEQITGVN